MALIVPGFMQCICMYVFMYVCIYGIPQTAELWGSYHVLPNPICLHESCRLPPRCPVPGARCLVPDARCPVPGTRCPVPGARCPVPRGLKELIGLIELRGLFQLIGVIEFKGLIELIGL